MKTYYSDRCNGGSKNQNFWKTVKPLLQSERNKTSSDIILQEGEENITNKLQICNIFNAYFSSIAQNIGFNDVLPEIISRESVRNMISKYDNHPSVQDIKINMNIKRFLNLNLMK